MNISTLASNPKLRPSESPSAPDSSNRRTTIDMNIPGLTVAVVAAAALAACAPHVNIPGSHGGGGENNDGGFDGAKSCTYMITGATPSDGVVENDAGDHSGFVESCQTTAPDPQNPGNMATICLYGKLTNATNLQLEICKGGGVFQKLHAVSITRNGAVIDSYTGDVPDGGTQCDPLQKINMPPCQQGTSFMYQAIVESPATCNNNPKCTYPSGQVEITN